MRSFGLRSILLTMLVLALVAPCAQAANTTYLHDDFDDGSPATNGTGVGTGFVYPITPTAWPDYPTVVSTTESGGNLVLSKFVGVNNSNYHYSQALSNDTFNAFAATPTLIQWDIGAATGYFSGVSGDTGFGSRRDYIGVRDSTFVTTDSGPTGYNANGFIPDPFFGPVNHGIFIALSSEHGTSTTEGRLVWWFSSNAGGAVLATWNYNTSPVNDMTDLDDLTFNLVLTSTTYSLSFGGADGAAITLGGGALSGSLPVDSRPASTRVGVMSQVFSGVDNTLEQGVKYDYVKAVSDPDSVASDDGATALPTGAQGIINLGSTGLGGTITSLAALTLHNISDIDGAPLDIAALTYDFDLPLGEFSIIGITESISTDGILEPGEFATLDFEFIGDGVAGISSIQLTLDTDQGVAFSSLTGDQFTWMLEANELEPFNNGAVPEPASLTALALVTLALRRRRR